MKPITLKQKFTAMKKNIHFTHSRFLSGLATAALAIFMFLPGLGWGQTQLAAWTFDATAAAPSTPSSVAANLERQSGTATLYAEGK